MFSLTEIVLLDGPRVVSLASLVSLVVMQRSVSPVFRMSMAARASSLMPSRCMVSCMF